MLFSPLHTSIGLVRDASGSISPHSGVATGGGGKRGNLPPPQPPIGHRPWDRCRSKIFVSEKNGGRFPGFAPKFYMASCWMSYSGTPSVKLRGPLGSFSLGICPPMYNIFILCLFLFFKCEFGTHPKNSEPNLMSFQFLTGGRMT